MPALYIDDTIEFLTDLERKQIPFAVARALQKAAKIGAINLQAQIASRLDNPTPYTLNATFSTSPKKGEVKAYFGIKTNQATYLGPEFFGGQRNLRPFETKIAGLYAIATDNVPRNQHGNVPLAVVNTIMKNAQAKTNGYYQTNRSIRYRDNKGQSIPLYQLTDTKPAYTPQLSLEEAVSLVNEEFPDIFSAMLEQAIKTAK